MGEESTGGTGLSSDGVSGTQVGSGVSAGEGTCNASSSKLQTIVTATPVRTPRAGEEEGDGIFVSAAEKRAELALAKQRAASKSASPIPKNILQSGSSSSSSASKRKRPSSSGTPKVKKVKTSTTAPSSASRNSKSSKTSKASRNGKASTGSSKSQKKGSSSDAESSDEKITYTFSRKTRGKRISALVGEEAEADEQFWGQDAWKEKEEDLDDDIQSDEFGSEASDVEDADFDAADEDTDEEEVLVAPEKKTRGRKTGVYVDPAVRRRSSTIRVTKAKRGRIKRERVARTFRSSTANQSEAARAQRAREEKERAERKVRLAEARKRKPRLVQLTQQQLLEEAVRTEAENRRSLLLLLHIQEEKKRQRNAAETKIVSGARVTFRSSRAGGNTLTFRGVASFPGHTKNGPPKMKTCAVTGLPAKYKDPLTGAFYATKAAFKTIRQRVAEENAALRASQSKNEKVVGVKVDIPAPTAIAVAAPVPSAPVQPQTLAPGNPTAAPASRNSAGAPGGPTTVVATS